MNLVLHTFRKDVRRLWPAILVSLLLLGVLTRADRWRADSIINPLEGWLNLVLPLAWACVIALAVLQEPLAGDRHFWLTRPHRWPHLLAAKVMFAALFVHVPALLADAYVLAARGFSPLQWLPQLLGKQLAIAAFLTLPALALSALIPSFTQFMLGMFAIAAAAAFTFAGANTREPFMIRRPEDYLRGDIIGALIACVAIVILLLQYRRRPAVMARTVGIGGALLAGALIAFVPDTADYQLRALLHPIPAALSLRVEPRPALGVPLYAGNQRSVCSVPVKLDGLPAQEIFRIGATSVTVTAPDGRRYESTSPGSGNQYERVRLQASLVPYWWNGDGAYSPLWMTLTFDPQVYAAIKDGTARITGQIVVRTVRTGETSWMPVGGRVDARDVGHCSNQITEDRWSMSRIKVLCESPGGIPPDVHVAAWTQEDGRRYPSRLGDFGNPANGPQLAWLSPLNRSKTFFNLSDPAYRRYPITVEVPMEYLDHARIAVTPELPTGYAVVNFDLGEVALSKYWVEPQKPVMPTFRFQR